MSTLLAPPPPPPVTLSLTVADAARAAGLSHRTLTRLIETGELPSLRVGRRRLVRVTDLDQFLAARVAG